MNRVFYIDIERKKRNTAGAKAPDDIAEICGSCGYKKLAMPLFPNAKPKPIQKLWLLTVCVYHWWRAMKILPSGSTVLYQHPQYGVRVAEKMIPLIKKRKQCKFICIIHDLETLRGGIAGVIKDNRRTNEIAEDILLRHMDCLICHNEHMRDYLIERGYSPKRLVPLEIFDYLTDFDASKKAADSDSSLSIAIAGNLAVGKSGYIYQITEDGRNPELKINLYGNNYDETKGTENMCYKGSFKPEELPKFIEGGYGLVWDGVSSDTCAGNTGEYLRYNNPHKTSLYLASGMPVIVWREAAVADFVLKNDVGIAVESLNGLENVLKAIGNERYREMRLNACRIGRQIRNGQYFMRAMEKALDVVNEAAGN